MGTIYVSETALVTLTGTCECPWTTLEWKVKAYTVVFMEKTLFNTKNTFFF